MGYSLKVTGKILGVLDVFGLRALVAASEKYNDHTALADEIDPVSRSIRNPKFRDTVTNRTDITWVP
jgi:hypothetical protein